MADLRCPSAAREAKRGGTNGGAIERRHGGRRQEEKQPADWPQNPRDAPGRPQVKRTADARFASVEAVLGDVAAAPPGQGPVRWIHRAGGGGAEAAL